MAMAKVVGLGKGQSVHLPKEFRLQGKEVEISRRGSELVLRKKPRSLARAFRLLAGLPGDFEPRRALDSKKQQVPRRPRRAGAAANDSE
jgi:antitoxin VapB